MIKIYTDGSCKGNPGPGGFGVIQVDDETKSIYVLEEVQEEQTTNLLKLMKINLKHSSFIPTRLIVITYVIIGFGLGIVMVGKERKDKKFLILT